MEQSQLLKLCQALHKKELKALDLWLRSPFFNLREDVLELFVQIRIELNQVRPDFNKQRLHNKIWPDTPFDDAKFRHLMSFLLKQIKDYLSYAQWQKEPFRKSRDGIKALFVHQQDQAFAKEVKKLSAELNSRKGVTHQRHLHKYLLHFEQMRASAKSSRTDVLHLQETSDSLFTFFVCETLRIACLMISHQTVNSAVAYDQKLLAEVLRQASQPPLSELPEIAIYYNIYHALTDTDDEGYFKNLKKRITTHWQEFDANEMRDIYLLAINYCIKKLNSGKTDYIQEALELYKLGLSSRILFEHGEISGFAYKNTLALALMSEEFDWARHFLEEYRKFLPSRIRENTYLYNLATYYFKKQDYAQVMDLLQTVRFRDVFYNLDARRMLLRSYFETGAMDALESLLDSFQTFIRRRHDLGYQKENFVNLIKFIRKLIKTTGQSAELAELKRKVEATSLLAEKDWLLEKIEDWGSMPGSRG